MKCEKDGSGVAVQAKQRDELTICRPKHTRETLDFGNVPFAQVLIEPVGKLEHYSHVLHIGGFPVRYILRLCVGLTKLDEIFESTIQEPQFGRTRLRL